MQAERETKLNIFCEPMVESYIQSHFIPGARFQKHSKIQKSFRLNDPLILNFILDEKNFIFLTTNQVQVSHYNYPRFFQPKFYNSVRRITFRTI
jgi:hypothetical protein